MNIYPSDWPLCFTPQCRGEPLALGSCESMPGCTPCTPPPDPGPITVEEIRRIVQAEFAYWQKASAGHECGHTIALGAVAAAANINAAIMGHLAPWHHPGYQVRAITIPDGGCPENKVDGTHQRAQWNGRMVCINCGDGRSDA